ncbi:MAG: integrase family protein [Nitrospinota bacterium]|nr:integrase family protein [Nitrospinota bacterium]
MPHEKITKKLVDHLSFIGDGQVLYWDTELKGFGLRITKGAKAYFAEKRVNGKTVRTTIGRHGPLTPDQARKKAQELLGSMTMGRNPVNERRQARAKSVTLAQAFESFLEARKALKPRTVADYKYHMKHSFADWQGRPIRQITKDMVARRHKDLGAERGAAQANLSFRYLRSIFNFAMGKYEDAQGRSMITENPVRRLSQTRAWFSIERRRTYIKDSDLGAFLDALDTLRDELEGSKKTTDVVPDYLEFILLTGLRRNEAARVKWKEVDLEAKTFTITDTKNKQPLTLPMSDKVFNILSRRHGAREGEEYVFAGEGEGGYIVEPKRQMKKIIESSGVNFTIHDLRRTFATVAESLDISGYALKRLLNHKQAGDVTAGYIVHDVERLRAPMQAITDAIMTRAGRKGGAEVIPINRKVTGKEADGIP